MDSGVDLEAFKELARLTADLAVDNSEDEFEDEDIEESLLLEELPTKKFLEQSVLKQREDNICHLTFFQRKSFSEYFHSLPLVNCVDMWPQFAKCGYIIPGVHFYDRNFHSGKVAEKDLLKRLTTLSNRILLFSETSAFSRGWN